MGDSRMPTDKVSPASDPRRYWRINLRVLSVLLIIWFTTSILLSVVWAEALNQFKLAGFPVGFWMSQQGAILIFVLLILVYAIFMGQLDKKFHAADSDQ